MGLVSRWLNSGHNEKLAATDYIDLSEYAVPETEGDGAASTYVRVAEIQKVEDIHEFAQYVYDGNILILDFKKVAGDEILLKRLTSQIRKLAQDVGGDIAGLGDTNIILTPTSVRVDRRKLKADPL